MWAHVMRAKKKKKRKTGFPQPPPLWLMHFVCVLAGMFVLIVGGRVYKRVKLANGT